MIVAEGLGYTKTPASTTAGSGVSSTEVRVYNEPGFGRVAGGYVWTLGLGMHTSGSAGYKNDAISSLEVGAAVKVTLVQNSDGTGKRVSFGPGARVQTLKPFDMDDRTSLVIVEPVSPGEFASHAAATSSSFDVMLRDSATAAAAAATVPPPPASAPSSGRRLGVALGVLALVGVASYFVFRRRTRGGKS